MDLQLTAKQEIELIIEHSNSGRFDFAEELLDYPIDVLIPHFEVINNGFVRPTGWNHKSEGDKVVTLLGWIKNQLNRPIQITFVHYTNASETLKCHVIRLMDHCQKCADRINKEIIEG